MPRESMTSRQRWLAVLRGDTPDRVPMDYWATAETTETLCRHLGCNEDEAMGRLHIDRPLTVGGRYVGPEPKAGYDCWGIGFRDVDYGPGVYQEVSESPLAAFDSIEELEAGYTWPSPDWWDCGGIPDQVRGQEHRPIRGGGCELFYMYCRLRGMEQAYMDLVLNGEFVHHCLDRLLAITCENTRRIFEAIPGQVCITYVAEDLGSQEGLLFSPAQMHEFIFPRMKRMMALTQAHGSHVFTHSDGAIRPVIEDLIDLGVEVLNPIQWRCAGMEREALKADFGRRLVFHGGMDNQHTVPFGSVDDVRQEVLDNLRILGAGGGYILAPCHNIQAVTPPENIVAIYETGYENGWT